MKEHEATGAADNICQCVCAAWGMHENLAYWSGAGVEVVFNIVSKPFVGDDEGGYVVVDVADVDVDEDFFVDGLVAFDTVSHFLYVQVV